MNQSRKQTKPAAGPNAKEASRRGIALAVAIVTLLVVSLVAAAVLQSLVASHRQTRQDALALQAEWLAEAGLARGEWQLARDATYTGEIWLAPVTDVARDTVAADSGDIAAEALQVQDPLASGQVTIRVVAGSPRKLVVEALYPDVEHQRARARLERELPAMASSGESAP
jgi:Tfp pilus assembly protein PilX